MSYLAEFGRACTLERSLKCDSRFRFISYPFKSGASPVAAEGYNHCDRLSFGPLSNIMLLVCLPVFQITFVVARIQPPIFLCSQPALVPKFM